MKHLAVLQLYTLVTVVSWPGPFFPQRTDSETTI